MLTQVHHSCGWPSCPSGVYLNLSPDSSLFFKNYLLPQRNISILASHKSIIAKYPPVFKQGALLYKPLKQELKATQPVKGKGYALPLAALDSSAACFGKVFLVLVNARTTPVFPLIFDIIRERLGRVNTPLLNLNPYPSYLVNCSIACSLVIPSLISSGLHPIFFLAFATS